MPPEQTETAAEQQARCEADMNTMIWHGTDTEFLDSIITVLRDDPYTTVLHHPLLKRRYAHIKTTNTPLYEGKLLKAVDIALGARRAAQWDDSLAQTPPAFDPFVFTDARAILAEPIQPRRWLIPGLIAEGLTILGGSPKGGKSYLAYALALAVTQYGVWCGHWQTARGKALYVTLEDTAEDTHLRLVELDPGLRLDPGRLFFVHNDQAIPSFDQGLIQWIEEALQHHQPQLLIIDPISYLYVLKKSSSQFEETKDMLFPLRWLGKKYGCAVVCLDHKRKRSREEISMIDTLYGSVAKQAVADGIIMATRDDDAIELDATIRNGRSQKYYLDFTFKDGRCFLTYKGGETTNNVSDTRARLAATLRDVHIPLSVPELLAAIELPDTRQARNHLYQMLLRMQRSREVHKTERGYYVWAQREETS